MSPALLASALPSVGDRREACLVAYIDILRDWLGAGRGALLRVSGGSMRPAFLDGARILVEPCPASALRVADVVLYEDTGKLVCHRVLWRRRTGAGAVFLTKGDAARSPAVWIAGATIVGRVTAIDEEGRPRALRGARTCVGNVLAAGRSWMSLLGAVVGRAVRRAGGPRRAA